MSDNDFLTDLPLAGDLVAEDFDGWPDWLKTEFDEHANDGHVGSRLLSQDARVRVWEIRLAPGQRWHVHRHVLDYFWTAVTPGRSRQHTFDGTTREVTYATGQPGISTSAPASICCTTSRTSVTPNWPSPRWNIWTAPTRRYPSALTETGACTYLTPTQCADASDVMHEAWRGRPCLRCSAAARRPCTSTAES
jgi:hypothetical protein